ncbi:hypothetical protein [Candidatus Electronema sp. TJ]|uniref:hypothetical protein n=1 Tax=Candidatus Electronema sp. TJ TaxID=3401573 RepID=UPI003AA99A6B
MPHSFDSHDRKYLAELMRDLPVTPPVSLDESIERIKDFCNSQPPAEEFAEVLQKLPQRICRSPCGAARFTCGISSLLKGAASVPKGICSGRSGVAS